MHTHGSCLFLVTMYFFCYYCLKDNKTKYTEFEDKHACRGRKKRTLNKQTFKAVSAVSLPVIKNVTKLLLRTFLFSVIKFVCLYGYLWLVSLMVLHRQQSFRDGQKWEIL